ncbi:MAG TPA: non-homologous end-joining DNA ligase [Methanomassiliicoccales archaeon]|nr:non-homologous end-joining DNA ligase [Methanomassiliicoccales archaeon]
MYEPMLAIPGSKSDLKREGWIYEPKLDGTRAVLYWDGKPMFVNRRDHEITPRYPEFDFSASIRAKSCVLDGEIVVFDSRGNPSFRLLQKREHVAEGMYHLRSKQHPATYVVFDIIEIEGESLIKMPLAERKKVLERVISEGPTLRRIVSTRDGQALWDLVIERGTEGVMGKKLDSVYEPGKRSVNWIKIKTTVTMDCVIVGYTHEKRIVSSLALALYRGIDLVYVGRVGTGFDEKMLVEIRDLLEPLRTPERPTINDSEHEIIWVRPELCCEVEFLEFTPHEHLRAPVFRRMREDKPPRECTFDQVER